MSLLSMAPGAENLFRAIRFGAQPHDVVVTPALSLRLTPSQGDQVAITPSADSSQVRLVVTSARQKHSKIQAMVQTLAQQSPSFLQKMSELYENFVDGKNVDPFGNVFAVYSLPKNGSAVKNTAAILSAVEKRLKTLSPTVQKLVVELPEELPANTNPYHLLQELSELVTLRQYNRNTQKSDKTPGPALETLELVLPESLDKAHAEASLQRGKKLGEAINWCKYWVDLSTNNKSPQFLGEQAKQFRSETMQVFSRDKTWLEGKRDGNTKPFGLMLSVAQGNNPKPEFNPRMVEMVYTPKNGQYDKTILLVGKGITFDLGGNNRAPQYGHNMAGDMAGAAAVMATMQALDQLQIPGVRVVGLMPFTENALDGASSKPYDIYTARNGKSVLIGNTDAEGRLIMADALHYGMETYKPDMAMDMATLTGSKAIFYGRQNAIAVSGNHPGFIKDIHKVEQQLNRDSAYVLLQKQHHDWVTKGSQGKADIYNADLPESGGAKSFGLISPDSTNPADTYTHGFAQGAAFLREFLPDPTIPWAHLDIAGAEYEKREAKTAEQWATGFGVKDLVSVLEAIAQGKINPDRSKTQLAK